MLGFSTGLVAVLMVAANQQAPAQNYQAAYEYALRCFVVNSAEGDQANARRAFDAATRLGQLQNFSNRQVNADLDRWTGTEMVRIARDLRYRQQLLSECRRLGMAV
jgi:hypothetical protein